MNDSVIASASSYYLTLEFIEKYYKKDLPNIKKAVLLIQDAYEGSWNGTRYTKGIGESTSEVYQSLFGCNFDKQLHSFLTITNIYFWNDIQGWAMTSSCHLCNDSKYCFTCPEYDKKVFKRFQ